MRITRECTSPNYITSRPPKQNNAGLKLSVTDMDIFKDAINIIIELVEDESVDKNIRMRYFDKLAKVIAIEDYHIKL